MLDAFRIALNINLKIVELKMMKYLILSFLFFTMPAISSTHSGVILKETTLETCYELPEIEKDAIYVELEPKRVPLHWGKYRYGYNIRSKVLILAFDIENKTLVYEKEVYKVKPEFENFKTKVPDYSEIVKREVEQLVKVFITSLKFSECKD